MKLANLQGDPGPSNSKPQSIGEGVAIAATFLEEIQAYNFTQDQESYYNQSKAIVEKAAEHSLIPGIFSNSASFYSDLLNFIYNGTLLIGDDKKTQAYNGIIKELGLELFNNKAHVLSGDYRRPIEPIVYTPPPPSGLDGHTPSPPRPNIVPSKSKLDNKVNAYLKTEGCVNCDKVE